MTQANPLATVTTIIVPDEALLVDVAQQACAQHLHLLTNGRTVVLSPCPMPGWYPFPIKLRDPSPIEQEAIRCAA